MACRNNHSGVNTPKYGPFYGMNSYILDVRNRRAHLQIGNLTRTYWVDWGMNTLCDAASMALKKGNRGLAYLHKDWLDARNISYVSSPKHPPGNMAVDYETHPIVVRSVHVNLLSLDDCRERDSVALDAFAAPATRPDFGTVVYHPVYGWEGVVTGVQTRFTLGELELELDFLDPRLVRPGQEPDGCTELDINPEIVEDAHKQATAE